ncbi:hypothetical protein CANCADRAFT_2518 [Tortispora caseinolytica NRRL Y-17796]|uniref:CAP-Gly domain-containing protein n=1 Tax=Tortispora caseinolytica NRRL Y-17796 TaxID=767744 RepID=A0A1E4TG86_9ASCO|nr:hypothetical protein CANCADRAFT_2518 [Tortispora caseinolytica NRRL Y-17796]
MSSTDSKGPFKSSGTSCKSLSSGSTSSSTNAVSSDNLAPPAACTKTPNCFKSFADSFKPYVLTESERVTVEEKCKISGQDFESEASMYMVSNSPLSRALKSRHMQMIAIGGSIGTGLFVGSGAALGTGGPLALILGFSIVGFMLFCTVHALGELASLFPVPGAFSVYSTRFIDPAWGFAMGWNFALQWLLAFPLELVAAALTMEYWNISVSPAVFVSVFWLLIVVINLFGVRGYGEAECIFSGLKVIAIVGFIILGICLDLGAGPNGSYKGTKYWRDPGPLANGFQGIAAVFVTAAFAFAGTELVGLAAAETKNPRKILARAVKQVFWRIALFYILSLFIVGLLVPYNDPRLFGNGAVDISASPFVIAIKDSGIRVLPSIMNGVVLAAVLSVGNSSIFACSRTLCALSNLGMAPKIVSYVDRNGRPLVATIITLLVGLFGFLAVSKHQQIIFSWMMATSGISSIFTWSSICLAHINFRRAWKLQNRSLDEIPFKSGPGVTGSYLGFVLNIIILALDFYVVCNPVSGKLTAESFFRKLLTVPIVIILFVAYKLYYRCSVVKPKEADLASGRRELDLEEFQKVLELEREELRQKPLRVSYEGKLGTVKYCGRLDIWPDVDALGVEWDDHRNGKHSGIYKGQQLFTCTIEGSGSFIKASRHEDKRNEFYEAIVSKYTCIPPSSANVVFGSKVAEEIGLDRARLLDDLEIVSLPHQCIDKVDLLNAKSLSTLRKLDLSYNLFESFDPIHEICSNHPTIRELSIEGNRFIAAFHASSPLDSVQSLDISNTRGCEGIISLFPNLTKLRDCSNHHSSYSLNSTVIKSLDLSNNCIHQIPSIPETLEELHLGKNQIRNLQGPTSHNKLQYLDLRDNQIGSWEDMYSVSSVFPSLRELRFLRNPVVSAIESGRARCFIVSIWPQITKLNGTYISQTERHDSELFFIQKLIDREITFDGIKSTALWDYLDQSHISISVKANFQTAPRFNTYHPNSYGLKKTV